MKTALITGGTVRIGLAVAETLRRGGWLVLTSSHRPGSGADILADLSEPDGAAKLYAAALRLLGGRPPDALVNNAGVLAGEESAVRRINLEAPCKLTTMMAARESGAGAVVNVLDSLALGAFATDATPYLQVKRDLLAETRRHAALFAATLRVNAVAPGPVLAPAGMHMKAGETLLDRRPAAADVAQAVSYLLGAEAVTGVVLPVDAGQHLLLEV